MTAIAGMISIYLGLFQARFDIAWFPALLLLMGLELNEYVNKKYDYDDDLDESEKGRIFLATALAIVGISLISFIISVPFYRRVASVVTLSVFDAKLYAGLMAVAEEQFFRGFLANFALKYTGNTGAAAVVSSMIGTIYHFYRYGGDYNALMFVFFGFLVLSTIALREQRLSPAILAHVIHNVVYA